MSVANQVRAAAARGGRALRALSPTAILVIGFAVFLLYAFPGYMSNDSVDQLLDARGHAFSDAHPPVMAAEWMILDAFVAGPILMPVVQGALFLAGLAGLLRQVVAPRVAALLAVAVLLFPPVLTTMAVVWKDSQMAAFLLAGTAALLSPRRGVRLLGWTLVMLGGAFRHNAPAAVMPIIGLLFVWRPGLRWWRRYLISGAVAVLAVITSIGLNRALTRNHVASLDGVRLADIAGVLNFTRDRSDAELREILRGVPLRETTNIQANARRVFSARSAMWLFYSDTSLYALPSPSDHPAIERAWRDLVFGDFGAYLAYRGAGFRELLGLSSADLWYPVYFQFLGDPEQRKLVSHNATSSGFQQLVVFVSGTLAFQTPLFRPYLYALLALLLLILCCRDRVTLAVLASGLLYELSYFPAANTVDFRYSHWMIVCTTLATVMLFARRLRARHAVPVAEAPEHRARRVAARLAELRPRTILLIGWSIFALYAYPGYMSSDSVDQLLDARVGTFNDWHSPTMTEIWRWVGVVIAGPFGMLVLQSVLLLAGMYALIARVLSPRRAALVACGLLVFPPVMATMAVIWRDSQMAGFLVAGLAAITSRRRAAQIAGLGLLVLACNMRPSAPFAVLPIVVAGFACRGDVAGWRRAALALAVWAGVWLAASGLDALLRSSETEHERVELAVADVLGVLRYAGPLDDAAVRERLAGVALRGDHLQARGAEFQKHPAKVSTGPDRLFDAPTDAEGRAALFAARNRLALDQLCAYLTHRWHTTYRLLGLPRMAPKALVFNGFTGGRFQSEQTMHTARHSMVQRALIVYARMFAYTPICWPYVYVVAAIVLLVLVARRRQAMPTILLASGLVYELSLTVVAVAPSAALSHWLVTATCLAGVLMLAYGRSSISASCSK